MIGIREDSDGFFYWTLNGEWLLDDAGRKIRSNGTDGKDGEPGNDGIDGHDGEKGKQGDPGLVPEFKIENGRWYMRVGEDGEWEYMGPFYYRR